MRLAGAKLRALNLLQRLREARGPSVPSGLPPQRPASKPKSDPPQGVCIGNFASW